jgi:DNA mismatch repair protein MutS
MTPRNRTTVAGATASRGAPGPGARDGKKTPMMEQFWRAKDEHPDALIFFRMGDFYEMFGEDAVTASRELGITLTKRDKDTNAMPMAGVPVKSMDGYLLRLVRGGFKVAICEQLQDPKKTKGIVDRGVVRVVTAGTLTEEDALDARASNYLVALWPRSPKQPNGHNGLAWVDVSTGRFHACDVDDGGLLDELARLAPAELLVAPEAFDPASPQHTEVQRVYHARFSERDAWRFDREAMRRALERHFKVRTLAGFGIDDASAAVPAAGALIEYLEETQKAACTHIRRIEPSDPSRHLVLDRATRSTLELVETQRGARREGTLLDVLDGTRTPMGGRLLREWLLAPLREVEPIRARQGAVAELFDHAFLREEVRDVLGEVRDLERLIAKLSTGRANGRDLRALALSTQLIPALRKQIEGAESELLASLHEQLDPLVDLTDRVLTTIADEPPLTVREGGVIRSGVDATLDELRSIAGDGKAWMAKFQASEAQRTGIANLKIGYNSVFGYYLEVSRGQVASVPPEWIRKQTIKTAERYITPELKEFETKVLSAEDEAKELELRLFDELRDELQSHVERVLETAHAVATLDALASLAESAATNRYVRPEIDDSTRLEITGGRHPVIELSSTCDTFVPNDSRLDADPKQGRMLAVLTGPNMAGKSTYIRQTALIVLLAQIGAFVPAETARIGVVDRIFTRVGSGDDISRGESTFMVEMVEIANILNNAGPRSLVVLDEVGRGTSTFDGLALAWAIVEHLHERVGARALFATHYHQLTALSERLAGVFDLSVAVRESGDEIVFLHTIVEGGTDRSYGIHVARLAGVPAEVLTRAQQVLATLEDEAEHLEPGAPVEPCAATRARSSEPAASKSRSDGQLSLFAPESEVEREIRSLALDSTTPLDALLLLKQWQDRLR